MPINITTQELLRSRFSGYTSGQPMRTGATLNQNEGALTQMLAVPNGQVFLLTHIIVQADYYAHGNTIQASPEDLGDLFPSIGFNERGGSSEWIIGFRSIARWNNTFATGGSPTWKTAPPGNARVWKLKYPIPVPPGWTVIRNATQNTLGNQSAVHGVFVDENDARTMGFGVEDATPSTARSFGIAFNNTAEGEVADLIPAVTGKSIRILDMSVQIQAETDTDRTVTLSQTDGRNVFRFSTSNPADPVDLMFSPDIYLASGQALQITATATETFAVTVTYEYVDDEDVPGDHWWAFVDPALPTPAGNTVGFLSLIAAKSTQVDQYYPRRDTEETAASKGHQSILQGYCLSIQKDQVAGTLEADATDQTFLTISTGASAGQVAFGTLTLSQTNHQLAPVFTATGHDQNVTLAVDDLYLPGLADTGVFWIDTAGAGNPESLASPTATDADIAHWAMTLWGRTIPTTFTAPTNAGV